MPLSCPPTPRIFELEAEKQQSEDETAATADRLRAWRNLAPVGLTIPNPLGPTPPAISRTHNTDAEWARIPFKPVSLYSDS